jgi:hypothetical protein
MKYQVGLGPLDASEQNESAPVITPQVFATLFNMNLLTNSEALKALHNLFELSTFAGF